MAGLIWYRAMLEQYADPDGYYPDMHVGEADNVVYRLTKNNPYVLQPIPAGVWDYENIEKLVGGTVAWNQLCNSSSVTGTSGHKFYLKKGGAESITNTDTFTGLSNGTDMVIDLTLMLGSTLADYVYSLEQATAGSGIAWLKKYDLIDDQYHAYSQGSLESVNVSAHVMRDADNNIIETYPIDSSVTLRGIPKKDADGNLYYDGDTYECDGTITRKYAEVDLGTLNWIADSNRPGVFYTNGLSSSIKIQSGTSASLRCSVYTFRNANVPSANNLESANGTISGYPSYGGGYVFVIDLAKKDMTTADFKTAMSGVYLVYELATQTTESADPYTALQVCDPDGTEEWVDYGVAQGTRDYAVPAGSVRTYERSV